MDERDTLRPVGTRFSISHEDEDGQTRTHTWEVTAHAQGAGHADGSPSWHEVLAQVQPTLEEALAAMGEDSNVTG